MVSTFGVMDQKTLNALRGFADCMNKIASPEKSRTDWMSGDGFSELMNNGIAYLQALYREVSLSRLTTCEREVYLLHKKGYSDIKIAETTHRAIGTVKNQLSRARKKLKAPLKISITKEDVL
jgi:DNA-binding NarL/FixJ family response regulator